MTATEHKIRHQYQPTPTSCSPTALSMLLEHHGLHMSPEEIEGNVPQVLDKEGAPSGTITQQLATWVAEKGFEVSLYTFDCQVIDQSWAELPSEKVLSRLEKSLDGWTVPALGEDWTRAYKQSYINFLKTTGCELIIQPAVTSELLYKLLGEGPVFLSVCINTLYGRGRTTEKEMDDINGRTWNHSIVLHGNDEQGNLLIADPLIEPGFHAIDPERMIAAITAAQIECDNLIFQLQKA